MHASMHAGMRSWVNACTDPCVDACVDACMDVSVSACIHACIYAFVHAFRACMDTCIYACMDTCFDASLKKTWRQDDASGDVSRNRRAIFLGTILVPTFGFDVAPRVVQIKMDFITAWPCTMKCVLSTRYVKIKKEWFLQCFVKTVFHLACLISARLLVNNFSVFRWSPSNWNQKKTW